MKPLVVSAAYLLYSKPSQVLSIFTQVSELEVYAYLRDSDCSQPHREAIATGSR